MGDIVERIRKYGRERESQKLLLLEGYTSTVEIGNPEIICLIDVVDCRKHGKQVRKYVETPGKISRDVQSLQLEDQIEAIRELGESRSQEAHKYLKWLYRSDTQRVGESGEGYSIHIDMYQEHREVEIVSFPNARGPLRTGLDYTLYLSDFARNYAGERARSEEDIEADRRAILQRKAHTVITNAILHLEADSEFTSAS